MKALVLSGGTGAAEADAHTHAKTARPGANKAVLTTGPRITGRRGDHRGRGIIVATRGGDREAVVTGRSSALKDHLHPATVPWPSRTRSSSRASTRRRRFVMYLGTNSSSPASPDSSKSSGHSPRPRSSSPTWPDPRSSASPNSAPPARSSAGGEAGAPQERPRSGRCHPFTPAIHDACAPSAVLGARVEITHAIQQLIGRRRRGALHRHPRLLARTRATSSTCSRSKPDVLESMDRRIDGEVDDASETIGRVSSKRAHAHREVAHVRRRHGAERGEQLSSTVHLGRGECRHHRTVSWSSP